MAPRQSVRRLPGVPQLQRRRAHAGRDGRVLLLHLGLSGDLALLGDGEFRLVPGHGRRHAGDFRRHHGGVSGRSVGADGQVVRRGAHRDDRADLLRDRRGGLWRRRIALGRGGADAGAWARGVHPSDADRADVPARARGCAGRIARRPVGADEHCDAAGHGVLHAGVRLFPVARLALAKSKRRLSLRGGGTGVDLGSVPVADRP